MTNALLQLSQQVQAQLPPQWHGFTLIHGGLALTLIGWVTHANWDRVIAGWEWVSNHGGLWGIGKDFVVGNKKPASQPTLAPPVPRP